MGIAKIVIPLLALLLSVAAVWATWPVSGNLFRYAWWRTFSHQETSGGYVQSGDASIFYRTYGSGPPLVLLHGGFSSSLDWFSEIPELSGHYRTILVDLRGHGRSTMGGSPFSYRLLAGDVLAVLDTLEIAQSDMVGWSDGGNAALLFELQYPERVRRLVTISANYNPGGIKAAVLAQGSEDTPGQQSLVARWLHALRSPEPGRWGQLQSRVLNMWRHFPQLETGDLAAVASPTLVIVGGEDYVDTGHAHSMAAAIPGARLLVLPGVGHAVPRDAPAELLSAIEQFLAPAPLSLGASPERLDP
jgi:pimeloyl-ACP methyl ester carboxylesterase